MTLSKDAIAGILGGARIFAGLGYGDFQGLLRAGRLEHFDEGEEIYRRGQHADRGFILLTGRVELVERPYPGRRLGSHLFTSGALFSVNGFIKDWRHKHSGRAVEETAVLSLRAEAFRPLLDSGDPSAMRIVDAMLDVFVHDVRATNQSLEEIHSRPDRTLLRLRQLMAEPTSTDG